MHFGSKSSIFDNRLHEHTDRSLHTSNDPGRRSHPGLHGPDPVGFSRPQPAAATTTTGGRLARIHLPQWAEAGIEHNGDRTD